MAIQRNVLKLPHHFRFHSNSGIKFIKLAFVSNSNADIYYIMYMLRQKQLQCIMRSCQFKGHGFALYLLACN